MTPYPQVLGILKRFLGGGFEANFGGFLKRILADLERILVGDFSGRFPADSGQVSGKFRAGFGAIFKGILVQFPWIFGVLWGFKGAFGW